MVPVRTKAKLQAAANEHMAFIDATPSVCGPISRTLVSRTRHEDLFVPDQKARRIEFARGIGYCIRLHTLKKRGFFRATVIDAECSASTTI